MVYELWKGKLSNEKSRHMTLLKGGRKEGWWGENAHPTILKR
jgi:hypothetical protein